MNALLVGATGLVGSHLLTFLLESPEIDNVIAPVRRSTGVSSAKLIEVPFDAEGAADWTPPVPIDHVFIAFGTTKKKAGGINAQHDIEVRLPRLYAQRAKKLGARHLSLCSAIGADEESNNAYNAMKGRLEEDIRAMRYPSITFLRPSVLGGHRTGDDRPAEAWAQRAMSWLPKSLKTIPAKHVARAMLIKALEEKKGVEIISSRKIWKIAEH